MAKKTKRSDTILATIGIVVGLPILFLSYSLSGGEGSAEGSQCDDLAMAFTMAQAPIKAQLKSPSTADFASIRNSDVSVVSEDPCRYFVRSHVDAQNGFGAQIRNGFSVEIENVADGWRTISATLDG